MSKVYTGRDVYLGLQATRKAMVDERKAWLNVHGNVDHSLKGLPRETDAAWAHLCEVVVPQLDARVLDEAAARVALPQIAARAVAEQRELDRRENEKQQSTIARDPRYVDRAALLNAAQIRLAEVDDAYALLAQSVDALRSEQVFDELIREAYGTDDYTHKFWEVSYYRHWKHADLIVEKHGKRLGVSDFSALRHKFLDERDALVPLEAARAEQQNITRTIRALAQSHEQAKNALQGLDARALAFARGRVREHLSALPPDEMTRLLQSIPAWRVAGARVLGLAAKRAYLTQMAKELIIPFEEEWRDTVADLDQRIAKMSRPKKWHERMDEATYLKRIGRTRLTKWQQRRGEVQGATNSVIGFDRYDSYDPVRDYLWWDVMTGGRYHMPTAPTGSRSAVLWGDDDNTNFRAAGASARSVELDTARGGRDFS